MKRSCIFLVLILVYCSGLFATATDTGNCAGAEPRQKFRLSHTVIFSDLSDFHGIRPMRGLYNNIQQPDNKLGSDIIISLNSDLRRSRIAKASAVFTDVSNLINIIILTTLLKKDATSPVAHSSYRFSSTDFHRFIFRLKPF